MRENFTASWKGRSEETKKQKRKYYGLEKNQKTKEMKKYRNHRVLADTKPFDFTLLTFSEK